MTTTLRLFRSDAPGRQIDSRVLADGELRIGRDAGQDWALDDPGRLLSRSHLVLAVHGDRVTVTDTSSNGVFMAEGDRRLPQGRAAPVEPGTMLRFGPYLLMVERGGAAADASAAPFRDEGAGASPFAPRGEAAPRPRESRSPFGDVLAPDPFGGGLEPEASPAARAPAAPASTEDAWSRPRERRVGDWDAPSPRREGHERLIGSGRTWSEPPAPPPPEVGFGFDAPFSQPILRDVEVASSDLAIPSDWDAAGEPRRVAPPAPEPLASPRPVTPAPVAALFADEDEPPPAPGRAARAESPPVASPPPMEAAPPTPQRRRSPAKAASPTAETADPSDAAAMLDAFCRGAKLDPAVFSRVAPEEVMVRAGVVYRAMILGMSDLMSERTSLKNEYRMVRTTMRPERNSPFKWLPPQTVATQLLLEPEEGFMGGAEAVSGAFQDLKKHLLCLLSGLRAALTSTLEALAPAKVEEGLKEQSLLMKNKGAAAWSTYGRLYADWRQQADDNPDSPVNRAFRSAYERQLMELDRMTSD